MQCSEMISSNFFLILGFPTETQFPSVTIKLEQRHSNCAERFDERLSFK